MISKPRFKHSYEVKSVGPKHTFLLNEHRSFVLEGEVYPLLVPLLDGQHTIDDILSAIDGQIPFQKVIYALHVLEQKGHLVEGDDPLPAEMSAFWNYLDVEGAEADRRLREAQVVVRAVGDVTTEPLVAALRTLGIE